MPEASGNVVSGIASLMKRNPNTTISVQFGDAKSLSPWRVMQKYPKSSGKLGKYVTVRDALEALNEVIAQDDETLQRAFVTDERGNISAIADTPMIYKSKSGNVSLIAVSYVEDLPDAEESVSLPTAKFLSRKLSDFSELNFVQISLQEVAQINFIKPEKVASLVAEVEAILPPETFAIWKNLCADIRANADATNSEYVQILFEEYRKSAEQGNATAQCFLGVCYALGLSVEQDYAKAVEWYRKSAEQGEVTAQNNLGVCYAQGQGVEQDYAKAVEWYRKSAEQGEATAQCNLGGCYNLGQGVEQDYAKAVEWYRKSAEQGEAMAQFKLGLCYERGRGVEQDYAKAVEWYRKSAEQGDATAQCNLCMLYYYGAGVEKNITNAKYWIKKAEMQVDKKYYNYSLKNQIANSLNAIGDYTKAETYIASVIREYPNDASYLDTYADTLIGLQRYDEAMDIIEKARQNTTSKSTLHLLAMRETAVLIVRNDYAKASKVFATIDNAEFGVYEKATYDTLKSKLDKAKK